MSDPIEIRLGRKLTRELIKNELIVADEVELAEVISFLGYAADYEPE